MNYYAIKAIYLYEMSRTYRTISQSLIAPVISTILYFVVFGSAIGSKIENIEGISYGVFIVPGLVMLSVLMQSITNAAFAIYFPKFVGTINELLSFLRKNYCSTIGVEYMHISDPIEKIWCRERLV